MRVPGVGSQAIKPGVSYARVLFVVCMSNKAIINRLSLLVTPTLKFVRIKEQGPIPYLVSKIKNNV